MSLSNLLREFGKSKLNTLTKYPSILTLHEIGKKNRLTDKLTTSLVGKNLYATEKIDGTSIRLLYYKGERIVGTRENLFTFEQSDFINIPKEFFSMINYVKPFYEKAKWNIKYDTDKLTVLYGELYGSTIGSNAKNYGTDKIGFRLFDVVVYEDLSILNRPLEDISRWREKVTANGIIYGQNFLTRDEMTSQFKEFEFAPTVDFDLGDMSHEAILCNLKNYIPTTNVALSESALKRPEGLILRSEDRSAIVKVRYEDYERTLRQ